MRYVASYPAQLCAATFFGRDMACRVSTLQPAQDKTFTPPHEFSDNQLDAAITFVYTGFSGSTTFFQGKMKNSQGKKELFQGIIKNFQGAGHYHYQTRIDLRSTLRSGFTGGNLMISK